MSAASHPSFLIVSLSKVFAYIMVGSLFLYLTNNYLIYWQDMPGPYLLLDHFGWFGEASTELDTEQLSQGWLQLAIYLGCLLLLAVYALRNQRMSLHQEAERFSALAAYLVRLAFWSVTLVGMADMLISFLRVEQLLDSLIGSELITQLGRPTYRGTYVHFPLIGLSFVLAFLLRSISFSWLALMVVISEFAIVITRFVFSYEQAFMGDLVRFWYAALFLFASAYTLVHEGHVRVDVLYAGFNRVKKSWSNIVGCLFLGLPLCWVILMQGMGGKGNSINSPLLSFEISQSGYGMYVKYLMAGFMVVFAATMIVQFVAYLLENIANLLHPPAEEEQPGESADSALLVE
jgi:TRAP-type mannitol/chloroaromatic compound transport system permease small subunit